MTNEYTVKRTIIGQLPLGADLYQSITEIVRREKIRMGRIQGLGATTHAVVAYYDQSTRRYDSLVFPGGMEILSLQGNISVRDDEPFVHLHIVLGDAKGRTVGGHLMEGTTVFACELFIEEFSGVGLHRRRHEATGLFLWDAGLLTSPSSTGV